MKLLYPVLVPVSQEDEVMENIMLDLATLGFMSRYGLAPISPYETFRDWFYNETGTWPTYFLLTDKECDAMADGLSVDLCGDEELRVMKETLLNENIREWSLDELNAKINEWWRI